MTARRPRLPSSISVKLLLFNVLLVFLPLAGVFSLRALEQQLLDQMERSMVQQARLVAAAMAGGNLNPDSARALIERLGGRSEARIRIVDVTERVLADSAAIPARPAVQRVEDEYSRDAPSSRRTVLYRVGAALWKPVKSALQFQRRGTIKKDGPASDTAPRTVVRNALQGRYAASLQESSGQRSLTLYSALPVRAGGEVVGVVVVSQSTSRILAALWRVRLHVFRVFVISVVAAAILSLLVSATIARPLVRLRDEADDLLDHRGRLKRTFRGSHRNDEIGDLTRALEKLTGRLERHLRFVESLPADVSHEFKNPLASIRTAAELLTQSEDEGEKAQLAATVDREVARLGRLLNGVREVSRIDAALETEIPEPVDVRGVLTEVTQDAGGRIGQRVRIELSLPSAPLVVAASPERLAQAFRNIVDNAASFTPDGGCVAVAASLQGAAVIVRVADEGPGIPPEHLERVFDRFFTFRPDGQHRDHDGLGLAIARAVVEGYGGSIAAMNRDAQGAAFDVRLPSVQ